jgi:hypothetical protein
VAYIYIYRTFLRMGHECSFSMKVGHTIVTIILVALNTMSNTDLDMIYIYIYIYIECRRDSFIRVFKYLYLKFAQATSRNGKMSVGGHFAFAMEHRKTRVAKHVVAGKACLLDRVDLPSIYIYIYIHIYIYAYIHVYIAQYQTHSIYTR